MKLIANIGGILIFAGAFYFTVYMLQKIIPVKYVESVIWSYKHKKFILPTVSVFVICVSSVMVLSSLNFHYLLSCGKAEGVVVVGQTMETLITYSPENKLQGIKEYDLLPLSIVEPYLYPGQTFKDAVDGRVMIKYPGYDNYTILFTNVIVYIFINLIAVMLLVGSFAAGFVLMTHHAAAIGVFDKVLNQKEFLDYFKQHMGISLLTALCIVTAVFVASGIIASLISTRFNPVIETSKIAGDRAGQAVLSKVNPGMVLKGEVVNKDTFSCRRYVTRRDEKQINRQTVSTNYNAWLVRFDDIYDYPVFVSRVFSGESGNPDVQEQNRILEDLLRTRKKAEFLVNEDYSISIN